MAMAKEREGVSSDRIAFMQYDGVLEDGRFMMTHLILSSTWRNKLFLFKHVASRILKCQISRKFELKSRSNVRKLLSISPLLSKLTSLERYRSPLAFLLELVTTVVVQ